MTPDASSGAPDGAPWAPWRATFRAGGRLVVGVSDGTFVMAEGFMNRPGYQQELAGGTGHAILPVASFLVPGETTVLIDAGVGPRRGRTLSGGSLLVEMAAVGVDPADVDVLAVSHFHLDHDGWIVSAEGDPTFPNATIRVGRADFEHFVTGDEAAVPPGLRMAGHLKEALTDLLDAGRVELLDDTAEVAPGVVALPAPGHTPGHTIFAVGDRSERLMILGDAMYCPAQLTDADLTAMHDADPVAARRTRELIQREVERHDTVAVGCHFPGLQGARVVQGAVVPA